MHLIREVLYSYGCTGMDLLEKKSTEVQEQAGGTGRLSKTIK